MFRQTHTSFKQAKSIRLYCHWDVYNIIIGKRILFLLYWVIAKRNYICVNEKPPSILLDSHKKVIAAMQFCLACTYGNQDV